MSFMDKAKAAAEKAKLRAQEGVEEVQTKKELAQAYWDLGHKTYELASRGALSNPELDPLVQRIGELEGQGGSGDNASSGGEAPAQPEQATWTTPPETPA